MTEKTSRNGVTHSADLLKGAGAGASTFPIPNDPGFTTRPELLGTFGMVSSTHWLATAAGMGILEKGGNAFDAAVATGFALQVVEPHMCGPAGDVPIVLYAGNTGKTSVICGQGVSPAAATIEKFRDLGVDLIPGNGMLPAVVPGAFDAWMVLLRDYGTLGLRDVLEPAINHARNGYPILPRVCALIAALKELFETEWKTSGAVYLKHGDVPQPASLFTNPTLADTYERIVRDAEATGGSREKQIEKARSLWSQGFVAEQIDRFCRDNEVIDDTGRRQRALLTGDDIARWSATIEEPLTYNYHGYTVCKGGVWSQAPVFLQQLALLKDFDVGTMDPVGPDFVHTVIECAKLAFADREKFYGDPNFVDVPLDVLLSDPYNESRRMLVGSEASLELRPGDVPGYGGPVIVPSDDNMPVGPVKHSGDTVHFDITDRFGNLISATPSGGWMRSSPVIPELGFCLGTRGQMFWLEQGHPTSLAPGKRPRTTLSPTIALKDGKPYMAFGTPGGDRQDQWALTFFLRHVHFGLHLQAAIDAPTFHTAHFPSSFYPRLAQPGHLAIEGRFPTATIDTLRKRGHNIEVTGDWSQGRITAVARDNGVLKAAANARLMQSYAFGR